MKLDRDASGSRRKLANDLIKNPQSKYIKNVMSIPSYVKDKNGMSGVYDKSLNIHEL